MTKATKMMRIVYPIVALSLLLTVACDTNTEEVNTAGVSLDLVFEQEMEELTQIQPTRQSSDNNDDMYDQRYIIRVYNVDKDDFIIGDCVAERIVCSEQIDRPNRLGEVIELPEGRYRIYAWSDYVDNGSVEDKFYETEDFNQIEIKRDDSGALMIGNNDFHKAYCGSCYVDVSGEGLTKAQIDMKCPQAKVNIVITGLRETFATRADNQSLASLKVQIRYNGFRPSVYSVFSDAPTDAVASVAFMSSIGEIDGDSACIGFDYLFVGSINYAILMTVNIFDKNNKLIHSCANIEVPIQSNHITTVSGNFLSNSSGE